MTERKPSSRTDRGPTRSAMEQYPRANYGMMPTIWHTAASWITATSTNAFFVWYNFCRVHQTLRMTPAMEAGWTDHIWTIQELLMADETVKSAA